MGFICIFFSVLIAFVVILTIVQCILKKGAALWLICLNAAFVMVMFILYLLFLVICSCIASNSKYIVENKKYEIEEMDKNKICLDGEEYEYSFEYDNNAESPYAKKIKYQYTKTEKFLFRNLLKKYAAIIYTNDRLLIQSHDSK